MKALKIIFFIIIFLFLLLLTAPFLFKGKIIAIVKEQANNQINAHVAFSDDIDLSIFKSFPNLTLGLKELSVSGINEFVGDTLFSAKKVLATLDIMTVIKGDQIKIRKIIFDQPRIHAIVLADGKTNWDIAKMDSTAISSTDTSSSRFNVQLKMLEVKDGFLVYDDKQGKMYSKMEHLNYTLEGDFTEKLFTMHHTADIASFTAGMAGINYLSDVKTTLKADIDADMNNFKFVFKENHFSLNDLGFGFDGTFEMPGEDMVMDIKFDAKQNEFKNFLSLIPALYTKDFKDLQSKGTLAFSGFVKGIYNNKQMPAFGLDLLIDKGWFKYPALPAPVEQVNLKLNVSNPDGNLDHTKIDLSKLHFELQGDPFDAHLIATHPMSDPFIDAVMKGKINLNSMVKIAPMPEGTKLAGIIIADVEVKGKVNAVEKGQYENFDAHGTLQARDIHYESKDIPKPLDVKEAMLSFTPKLVQLKSFNGMIGKSDIQMNGDLSNFFAYYFGKGTLKGVLTFASKHFDANEFLTSDKDAAGKAKAADTASMTVVEIPANIDFILNSKIDQLLYTNMEISNFTGNIHVAEQKLTFNKVALNTIGSTINMTGFYETTHPQKPTLDLDLSINNLDIQKAFKTFNTIKKIAPIAENIFGIFSTSIKMRTDLTKNMQPDYNTLFATGVLSIPNAEVKGVKAIDKVADLLHKPEFKQVGFKNAKINYKVEHGRIFTEPFDMKFGGQAINLSGSTGIDQTIDYAGKINISRKDLGAVSGAADDLLGQLNKQAGSNIKLSETIPVQLNIGGTFTNPKVGTNMGDMVKSLTGSLKDQAMDEINRRKKELEDRAKAEIEKVKNEAKLKGEQLKKDAENKVNAEADRLKKEAEAKAKAEQDRIKKEAEDAAKKKLKGIFGE